MTVNSEKPPPESDQDARDGKERKERKERDRQEDKLDEALDETFPASDPFDVSK